MTEFIETVVVGGGQAGLSASWHLKRSGREHVVLDRGRIGDTWRNRWDSFCLVTPNWLCQLPEFPYDGDEPHGFMLRDQIVEYVERFARSFEPPYRSGVEVRRVAASKDEGRFLLETSDGDLRTDNLIIAVGTHQHPKIPDWATMLPADIAQLHTRDYRNPAQLPAGAALVVGSGQSGCQIVEDLLAAGREAHLCVGNAGRLPRRYRGRDILEWEVLTGYSELPVDEHPIGQEVRFKAHSHLTGRDGGHTIDLRQFALDGVRLHGRLLSVDGATVHFADDLGEKLDTIDAKYRENLHEIDDYITQNRLEAPKEDQAPIDWQPTSDPLSVDLRQVEISSVIYGTGYRFDFSWIDLPAFDQRGYPLYEKGITKVPGLYFVGLHWLHTQGSGLFSKVGRDAGHVVDHLCNG